MQYAIGMPDCFEKTLIRTIYLKSWLSVRERHGEEFLLEPTKTPLLLLQDDLAKIQSQMVKENIEDTPSELLINSTVRLFSS